LGSIRIIRTSSGVDRNRIDAIMQLRPTLLPVPVEPAISRCGMVARSVAQTSPLTALPSPSVSRPEARLKDSDSSTSRR
jgi:hypothetical protein